MWLIDRLRFIAVVNQKYLIGRATKVLKMTFSTYFE